MGGVDPIRKLIGIDPAVEAFAALAFVLAVFFTLFEHVKQPGSP